MCVLCTHAHTHTHVRKSKRARNLNSQSCIRNFPQERNRIAANSKTTLHLASPLAKARLIAVSSLHSLLFVTVRYSSSLFLFLSYSISLLSCLSLSSLTFLSLSFFLYFVLFSFSLYLSSSSFILSSIMSK